MRWNARSILPITLAMGVLGCQSDPIQQDPAIGELRDQVATLTAAQQAQSAELAAAEEALGRLEAEKATRAELDGVASMRRPWTVSIPLESAQLEGPGAIWSSGYSGLAFRESGFSRMHVGFTLPDDYVEGSDLELRITWTKDSFLTSTCRFRLVSNGVKVARAGQRPLYPVEHFRGDANGWDATFPAPADDQIQALLVDIPGTTPAGARLRAGDHLSYALFRDPAEPADSCAGGNATVVFLGMSAHPSFAAPAP